MSDGEDSCTAATEGSTSPGTPDRSSPVTMDTSTDVAPTRRARRRVEPQPEVEETPKQQQQKEEKEEEPGQASSQSSQSSQSAQSSVAHAGWGYWGSWGKSILSTATATVATVGQGLTQVMEKAETSLGIPSPTELSAQLEEQHRQEAVMDSSGEAEDPTADDSSAVGGAMGMLSSLSSVVQSTGKTVISGGLDALEFIGKKTMDVIAEGDPGFKKTKGLMSRNATLSQVLREAKEREQLQTAESDASEKKTAAHYGVMFDDFQGLSHLEALEILSRESEVKVRSVLTTLSGDELLQLRDELDSIKDSFTLVEFDDEDMDEKRDKDGSEFEKELTEAVEGLGVSATAHKLITACRSACTNVSITDQRTEEEEEEEEESERRMHSVEEVHTAAIRSLAELTARSIELFHKLAATTLFSGGCAEAGVLSQLTVLLCKELSLLSKRFTSCLTAAGSNEKADVLNPLITGVFLEASNSASYIQDAFLLLLPILQISHIQRNADASQQ